MKIPNLPNEKPIDEKGQWTASWSLWLQQFVGMLQKQLSDQGLCVPQQPTTIITQLNKSNNTGTLIYDSETQQFKGNVNGAFKVFQLD
jgi:hypothetical protein